MSSESSFRVEGLALSPAALVAGSPVIGWILATAAIISAASGLLLLPSVSQQPTAVGIGIVAGCAVYTVLCVACIIVRRRRPTSVMPIGVFAWATLTFIAAAAIPQRAGVDTVGFLVMPAFLFIITVLGHRRLSSATLVYAGLLFGGVGLHHVLLVPEAAQRAAALGQIILGGGIILVFAALGDQVAQVFRRHAQRAHQMGQHHRLLFDRLPVGVLVVRDGRIVEHNDAAGHILGVPSGASLVGREFTALLGSDERETTRVRMAQAALLGPGESLPLRNIEMLRLDGAQAPVTVTSVGLDPAAGVILSILIDRTQQDQAQRALEQTQRLVAALFRVSTHTMAVTDRRTGEFLLVNPAYARVAGQAPESMIGRTVIDLGLVSAAEREAFVGSLGSDGSADPVFLTLKRPDGQRRELRQSITSTEFDGREVLVAVGRDVTEESQRERERLVILEAAPAAVYVVRHGRVTAASAQYERLIGLEPGQAVGRPSDADLGGAEAIRRVAAKWNKALRAGGIVVFEHEVHRVDGSTFPGRFTGRLIRPGVPDGFGMVWVIEDTTEQRDREAKLARAQADAEAASRAKSGFLATMSHEIRTPLNGILGLIELVRDPALDDAHRHSYLQLMSESAHALQEIVSDVIDVSRIESGQLQLEPQDFEMGPWLDSIKASFAALAEAKGLVLEVQAPPEALGWVHADPGRLRQILGNYVSNALKFTLKGSITVRLSRLDAQRLRFEVVDTGLGIPEAELPRLFQPFEQLRSVAGRTDPGVRSSGLGLSICRQLAQSMGGSTGARSEHGLGSCFWVEVVAPVVQTADADSVSALPVVHLDGLRLLVVDDNRINLVVGRRLLERAGASVVVAEGGEEALQCVDQAHGEGHPFDLVLMDVQMPGMNGFEALAALRTRPHGATLPVLAASAAVTTEEVDLTRAAGFDGFISKPLALNSLLKSVSEAVRRRPVHF